MRLIFKRLAFLILLVGTIMLPSAAGASLPGADLFTPDLALVSDIVHPIFIIINWGVGGYGLWLLLSSFWSLLRIAAAFFAGTRLDGAKDSLKSVVIGIAIVLITITGIWYKLLIAIWSRVSPKLDQVSSIDLDTIQIIFAMTKWFS